MPWKGTDSNRESLIYYPLALIHVNFVTHQYFVDIVRSMLLNIPNPVSDIYIGTLNHLSVNPTY